MKLRLAKKIMKTMGTPREGAYPDGKLRAACRRYERTRSAKEANALWNEIMVVLTPEIREMMHSRLVVIQALRDAGFA